MHNDVLTIKDLKVWFPVKRGILKRTVGHVKAVDGVSLSLPRGKTLGLVGESGCGKTTLAKACVRLVPAMEGEVKVGGKDILTEGGASLRKLRAQIQMIFQDPFSSLDPKMTVGNIIGEPIRFHRPTEDAEALVHHYMEVTGLRKEAFNRYPHEFSGGQRQRIGIARALATNPAVVVCDEPVSALDVSIQARVLNLMKRLQKEMNLSYLFISHDLSVIRHIADEVAVMYLGHIVERFPAGSIAKGTLHPYTQALIASIPIPEPGRRLDDSVLEGETPSPMDAPGGCTFQTRCPHRTELCVAKRPVLESVDENHEVACHHWREWRTKSAPPAARG